MKEKELLRVGEIAKMLDVAEGTVYSWVEKGAIPYYKIVGGIRMERAEVENWLNSKKRGGDGAGPPSHRFTKDAIYIK